MRNHEISAICRAGASILLAATLLFCMLWPVRAATDRDHGLLWEIRAEGASPSYLFGTIHAEDPEVLRLAAPVQRAFDAADTVVLEIMLDMEAMLYSGTAMLMMDGRRLSDILDRSLFEATARAISTRGIP